MIPSSSVTKFLGRKLKDCRPLKQYSFAQLAELREQLPARPPIWKRLFKHQRVCFLLGAKTGRFAFFLDCGCVSGETLLDTSDGHIRIDELANSGRPFMVRSRTPQGVRLVPANAPLRFPPKALYEVSFASGRKITVTEKHRFWNGHFWVYCSDLVDGGRLPVFDAYHPQSSAGLYPLESPQDARHCYYATPDLRDRCFLDFHPDDALLHLAANNDLAFFPSPGDAQALDHDAHLGGSEPTSTNSLPLLLSDRPSRLRSSVLDETCCDYTGFAPCANVAAQSQWCSGSAALAAAAANLPLLVGEAVAFEWIERDQLVSHRHGSLSACFDSITSVKYIRTDYYYDLHVPVHENYFAHGLCHHNSGKTLLSLALIRYFEKLGNVCKPVLVLVPNLINKAEWAREIDKHCPAMRYCVLRGSSTHKWQQLEKTRASLVIETYQGLLVMLCDKALNKRERVVFKPNRNRMVKLQKLLDGLIMDESTSVKSKGKLPFRICRKLSQSAKVVFALTGTPFGRDPTDMWAQLYLVDRGATLGPTLGLFRAAFFSEKQNYWGGLEYTFQKSKRPLLRQMLANSSIRYKANESDLPRLVSITKPVKLHRDVLTYAQQAKEALNQARGNYHESKNAFMRMRQLSSGWLGYKDDENGTKAEFEFEHNPKLDLLLATLQGIDPAYKVIVFCEFVFSGSMICRELDKLKLGHLRMYGGTKDPAAVLRAFDHEPDKRVLVLANNMSFGSNLQIAKYGIFFESPVAPITRKQCVSRFERQHSLHEKVFQYDLITLGTFDQRILAALAAGRDLFRSILDQQKA